MHLAAGESSLEIGLTEAMPEILGVLDQIPLQMATEPRAIVEDSKDHRLVHGAVRQDDLSVRLVKIVVP
jgi:hypothetical protein